MIFISYFDLTKLVRRNGFVEGFWEFWNDEARNGKNNEILWATPKDYD